MIVSDAIFREDAPGEMALTFRAWFNVGPGEELDLSEPEIRFAIRRGREYTRCSHARSELRRLARELLHE